MLNLFTSCSRNYAAEGEELRLLEYYAVFIGRLSPLLRKHVISSHPTVIGDNNSNGGSQSPVPAECPPVIQFNRPCYVYKPTSWQIFGVHSTRKEVYSFCVCLFMGRYAGVMNNDERKIHKPRLSQTFVSFMGFCNENTRAVVEEKGIGFLPVTTQP